MHHECIYCIRLYFDKFNIHFFICCIFHSHMNILSIFFWILYFHSIVFSYIFCYLSFSIYNTLKCGVPPGTKHLLNGMSEKYGRLNFIPNPFYIHNQSNSSQQKSLNTCIETICCTHELEICFKHCLMAHLYNIPDLKSIVFLTSSHISWRI